MRSRRRTARRAGSTIATADSEVLDRIRALGFRVTHYARYNYGISTGPLLLRNNPELVWGMMMNVPGLKDEPVFDAYVARLRERPAFRRSIGAS